MFREVHLKKISGRLLLHSLPGHYEEFTDCLDMMANERVSQIIALTPREEIARKSVHYAHAITAGDSRLPHVIHVPVDDYSVPAGEELDHFFAAAVDVAKSLKEGRTVLVHCGSGHGRTGMFTAVVLLRLGYDRSEALRRVGVAGSQPETAQQREVVRIAAEGTRE